VHWPGVTLGRDAAASLQEVAHRQRGNGRDAQQQRDSPGRAAGPGQQPLGRDDRGKPDGPKKPPACLA
jgi:hypothetical protein